MVQRNVIYDVNKEKCDEGNGNGTTIKFETESTQSSLCNYSDAYILVTRDIMITCGGADTDVVFENWPPFMKYTTSINNKLIDDAENIDIEMSMYNWSSAVIAIQEHQNTYGGLKGMNDQ